MATWIIGGLLLIALVFAAWHIFHSAKEGGCSGCPGGCSGCSSANGHCSCTPAPASGQKH